MNSALLVLFLSTTVAGASLDTKVKDDSWWALAFEKGDFEAARFAVLEEKGVGWEELVELLKLSEPEPPSLKFMPVSFLPDLNTAIDRGRDGNVFFDCNSWHGQNYLSHRWEAWCLRCSFAGCERREIDSIFEYLAKELPHAAYYRPQLSRTREMLGELYDSVKEGEYDSLWGCLEKGPPTGWLVVPNKISQEELARHAARSDKPVVLMPGASLGARADEAFTIPKACEVWLPRGLKLRMPKESRLDLGGRVLSYGDAEEPIEFNAGGRSWSGIRILESEPGTTWVQDWEVNKSRMGLQLPVNGYKALMVHRSRFVDCEVGVGGKFDGVPGSQVFSGTGGRLFVHECHFEGALLVGLAVGGEAHVVSCVMETSEVGLAVKGYGKAIVAFTEIQAVLPVDVQVAHDCLLAFGCSLRSKVKNSARVHVIKSSQVTFEKNYWGTKSFHSRYIKYVGVPTTEQMVLGADLFPLKAKPKGPPRLY